MYPLPFPIPVTIDESRLRHLVATFLEENQKLNLSAFRTEEHCWIGNVLDSLGLLRAAETASFLPSVRKMLDIGTGGGFPLLPLAICLPDAQCFGMDAVRKKIDAVQRIIDAEKITNATLLCGRSEEFGHDPALRATFDLVSARAVAPLSVLLEYSVPFLKVGGLCAFWKSTKIADELAMTSHAQQVLGAQFQRMFEYELPADWGKRTIVFFKKTRDTASEYPRKVGDPKLKPL